MCTIFIMDCSLASSCLMVADGCLLERLRVTKRSLSSFLHSLFWWVAGKHVPIPTLIPVPNVGLIFEKKMPWRRSLSPTFIGPPCARPLITAQLGGFTGQTNRNGLLDTAHWSTTTKEYSARRHIIIRGERRRRTPSRSNLQ